MSGRSQAEPPAGPSLNPGDSQSEIAALRLRHQVLKETVEALDEGFVVFDADLVLVFCNRRYREIYAPIGLEWGVGTRFEDVVRDTARHWLNISDAEEIEALVQSRLRSIEDGTCSFELRLDNGRWLQVNDVTMPNGYLVGTRMDITKYKEQELGLARAKRAAEDAAQRAEALAEDAAAASKAKSDFLATISHEIRTPMNGVLGMAGLLLDSKLDPGQREQVESIQESGEILLSLINDILDLSKIEAGRLDLEQIEFDLCDLVDSLAEMLGARAQSKQIDLACYVARNVPPVLYGDPGRLRQILLNLVGNAIKFTERGGVRLEVAMEGRDAEEAQLVFRVIDTGIGVAEEACARLFDKFVQADSSTTRRFGGSGLGLAICRELAQMMGGRLEVASAVGVGSTFTLSLSLPVIEGESRDVFSELSQALVGQSVLVVDDAVIDLVIFRRFFEDLGAAATLVSSGAEALEALASQAFDIAIVDHVMPGMDGVALAREIAGMDLAKTPTLVLASSSGNIATCERIRELGFDAGLAKPLRRGALLRCLAGLLLDDQEGRCGDGESTLVAKSVGRALRVLLVEDNNVNQALGVSLLTREGHRTDVAGNGLEAVEMVERFPYDLVLMDMQMPEMDGLEATQVIRERLGFDSLPIIAVTANAMKGDRERCLAVGMNDYISKPINLQALAEKLAFWCGDGEGGKEKAPSKEPLVPDENSTALGGPEAAFRDLFARLDRIATSGH